MSALAWWLIPLGATAIALAWAGMRTRPTKEPDPHTAMADQERFRAAMERPLPRTDVPVQHPRESRPAGQ